MTPAPARLGVSELSLFGGNPRRGDVGSIASSLAVNGQYKPIVVNVGTHTGRANEVLAGNHTLLAARKLGWSEVDVWLVDVDEQRAKAIVAADNRLADLGGYDEMELFALLDGLEDLSGTGYSDSDVAALRRDLFPDEPLTEPDDVPAVPRQPISELGQVWQLGDHRLLVGDSTDQSLVGGGSVPRRGAGRLRLDGSAVWRELRRWDERGADDQERRRCGSAAAVGRGVRGCGVGV